MFSAITTILSKFAGGWYLDAIVVAAGFTLGAAGGAYATHKIDTTKYQALQLKDAQAATASLEAQAAALTAQAATQHALDTEVAQGAVAEAKAQEKIVTRTITITKEIPVHVHDAPIPTTPVLLACIPYGLVRVLDAAILDGGSSGGPSDLALPPGKSDDDCAPVKATDLAASIAANYAVARANAEQLNALEASITAIIGKANESPNS